MRLTFPLHAVRGFLARFAKPHLILPASFLNSTAYSVFGLGLVYYLRDEVGASAGAVGATSALFSLVYFAGCFLFRPLNRRLLPRHSLVISSAAGAACMAIVVALGSLAGAMVFYALVGLSVALFWPPIMGWLSAGLEGQPLNRAISRFNIAWSTGNIAGPLVAGVLTELSPRLPLLAGSAACLAVGISIGIVSRFFRTIRGDSYRDPAPAAGAASGGTPLRFPSWVGVVGAYISLGALLIVVPIHGREALGLRAESVGVVLLLRALAMSVGFHFAGRLAFWHFRPAPMIVATVVLGLCIGALCFVTTLAAFVVVLPVAGLAISLAYSASVFHGVAGSEERARRMAIHEALLTAGMVIGSSGGGYLYQHRGVHAVLVALVAVQLVAAAVQLVLVGIAGSRIAMQSGRS